jgi:hypothetical protein
LNEPAIRDWGRLLQVLARLEDPQASDPAVELAAFLRAKEFAIEIKGFDLVIPLALRVPPLIPAGPLTIALSPAAGSSIVRTFKAAGEGTQQGLNTIYRLVPEQSEPMQYRPGSGLKLELPVRSGDQRFTLKWDEGSTKAYQFDRLVREPRLVTAAGTGEPATGVALIPIPGSIIPRLPILLPEVKP